MGIRKMLDNHKPMEEMEESEKDTVALSCLSGLVIGFLMVAVPMVCIGIFVLVVSTTP